MATAKIVPAPLTRDLAVIAREIQADYRRQGKPVYYAAVPYVEALRQFGTVDLGAKYGWDSAEEIVIRLVGNLGTWKGETAQHVKAELRAALAYHKLPAAKRHAAMLAAESAKLEASRQTELFEVVGEVTVTV